MSFLEKIEEDYVVADKSDVANQRVKRSLKKRRLTRKAPKIEKPSVSDLKKEAKKTISLDDPTDDIKTKKTISLDDAADDEPIETKKTISLDEDEFDADAIDALMDKYLNPAKPKRTAPVKETKKALSVDEEPIDPEAKDKEKAEEPIETKREMSLDDDVDIAISDLQEHIDSLQESCDSVARDRDHLDEKEMAVEIKDFKQARRKLAYKLDKIQLKHDVSDEQRKHIDKLWTYLQSIDRQLENLDTRGAKETEKGKEDIGPLKPANVETIQKEEGIEDFELPPEKSIHDVVYRKPAEDVNGIVSLDELVEMIKSGELTGDDQIYLTELREGTEEYIGLLTIKDTPLSEHLPENQKKEEQDTKKQGDEEEDIDSEPDELDDLREGDLKNKRNALKLMKDPYLLVLNPMIKPAEFKTALENASIQGILSQSIPFKEADSEPIHGTLVYFVRGMLAPKLKNELSLSGAHYSVTPFANTLFRKVSPFDTLALDKEVGQLNAGMLRRELNAEWHKYRKEEATGLEIPALQMRNFNSINYARFLSLKQRPVEMYHGDTPKGAGSPDLMYFLASEAEANACRKVLVNLKLPVQFYTGLYVTPDIDTEFKSIEPKSFRPTNALILKGKGAFKPNEVVEKGEKGDEEITQLDMLHAFAEEMLKNKLKVQGSFVKQRHIIGTHVVHFNADMTFCIIWGSPTYHANLKESEIIEMLPFVEKALTKYL